MMLMINSSDSNITKDTKNKSHPSHQRKTGSEFICVLLVVSRAVWCMGVIARQHAIH